VVLISEWAGLLYGLGCAQTSQIAAAYGRALGATSRDGD
jgi:hypothetical protein